MPHTVTSLVEVWIEIVHQYPASSWHPVTSLVEVWIEIQKDCNRLLPKSVTSLVEVWIEIAKYIRLQQQEGCHFPCGSVD